MKLTTAVLALLGAALFTTSANAYSTGDLIFGIYDTTPGGNAYSLEANLGLLSSLHSGETFTLTSDINSVFGTSVGTNLDFAIAATGTSIGGGGLADFEDLVTTPGVISPVASTSTPTLNIKGEDTAATFNSNFVAVGTTYSAGKILDTTTGSFDKAVNSNSGSFGFASSAPVGVLASYGAATVVNLEDVLPNDSINKILGTFTFDDGTLTYEATPALTPEPSTYALMAGGLLALLAFRRLRSNA